LDQSTIITNLEYELSSLETENLGLKADLNKLKKQKSRYYNMFKNSTVAIWEEDFSEAFTILKALPYQTEKDYSEYLDNNPQFLKKLISTIKILEINKTVVELFSAETKEHLLNSLDEIFIKESFDTLRDQFVTMATGGFHYEGETIGRRLNGEEFHIILSAFFPEKHGNPVFITMIEITDRIEKEKEQDKILKEILEQKNNADTLIDITFALASKTNTLDVLDSILEQTKKVVPYTSANIMLYNNNIFTVARHRGYDKFGAADFMTQFAEKVASEGIATTLRDSKSIHIIGDTKLYPNWKQFPATKYINSLLSIPIEWQGTTIGLLNLDSNKKNAFSEKDANKLKPISHAAAISIHKAKLFEQIEKDILDRKNTENNLKLALKEKEILLQEIHHRVKNNLTIIIALINLQDTKFTRPAEIELFEDLNKRIHSIALVHEKLYENYNLTNIDFNTYTYDLLDSIQAILIFRSDINIKIDIPQNIYFNLDKLIPLGLILNELITNSLKYAFPDSGGNVLISLKKALKNNYLILTAEDSGIGYPENVINGETTQLGLLLVNSLVLQINGSIKYSNINGAKTSITIPYNGNKDEQ